MRSFGIEISGNRPRGAELSETTRAAIVYALELGGKPTQIAKDLHVSRQTIYNTKNHFQKHAHVKTNPRSGRPLKLTPSERRYVFRLVRRSPTMSYKALLIDTDFKVSKSTLKRVLKRCNIRKWVSKKRIFLKKHDAQIRRAFCRKWGSVLHFDDVIFSDECSVQRKSNSIHQYVFSFKNERYRKDLVNLVNHGKDIRQMNGYTTNSYLDTLEEALLPMYEPSTIFQQDNARIHVAEIAKEWFEEHGIWVMEWPPHSPDLNPIENVWNLLKLKLFELYPQLAQRGRSKMDWNEFRKALVIAWDSIDQAKIDNFIRSMPRRIAAVQKAKGWYTKY
ncbi:uncharacterized protein N7477_009045 [Penicillium maclennaniae]|uniref:uncharacterized protein n=1 Tax=Penicillium maclennaniae TaxID=1343394 RepID=UPI00253FE347|nr:uncharacterized protein N7477_009045 [Penicillium maclennaniae]KAJ5661429.1 hypothetical protein N7477_009045 [Penicillium maclennaniae]